MAAPPIRTRARPGDARDGRQRSLLAARHSVTNVNVLGGLVCAHFVTTALTTVRAESVWVRRVNVGALAAAVALVVAEVGVGVMALVGQIGAADGVPFRGAPLFWMAAVTALAAVGDMRIMQSGALRGRPRIARHLWRMCFALFIATGSFFSIPERVTTILPEVVATPPLQLVPLLLPLVAMLYWLWSIRRRSTEWRTTRQDDSALARGSATGD